MTPAGTTLIRIARAMKKNGHITEDQYGAIRELSRRVPGSNHHLNKALSKMSRQIYASFEKSQPGWSVFPIQELPVRARNILVDQFLFEMPLHWEELPSPKDILKFRGCGPKNLQTIEALAEKHGRQWSEEYGRWCGPKPKS